MRQYLLHNEQYKKIKIKRLKVELYDSEEQQVEAIKDWWQANGKFVIIGSIVGLASFFGWGYYHDSINAKLDKHSETYAQVMKAVSENKADVVTHLQTFMSENKDTDYAVLAALQLAKVQIDADKVDAALEQLQWAKTNNKDKSLAALIHYRIARVLIEKNQLDEATVELNSIKESSWAGRVAELRGDIAIQKNDKEAAYTAYTEAQQAKGASQMLQIKLDDLAK